MGWGAYIATCRAPISLTLLTMVQYWEPGTQYNFGDVVQFEGMGYRRSIRAQNYNLAQVTNTR